MFASRYFNPRYWASRFWPKIGGIPVVITPDCFTLVTSSINDDPEVVTSSIEQYTILASKITDAEITLGKITESTTLNGGLCCGSTH